MILEQLVTELTPLPGVKGVLLVSRGDGLVVVEALQEDVEGSAAAALAARLADRMATLARALGQSEPPVWQLSGANGTLFAVPAGPDLMLVIVTEPGINSGELRLRALSVAERVA